jgi:hypothetical protein
VSLKYPCMNSGKYGKLCGKLRHGKINGMYCLNLLDGSLQNRIVIPLRLMDEIFSLYSFPHK